MPTKWLLNPMDGTPKQIVLAFHSTLSPSTNDLRITTDGSNELDVELDLRTSMGNTAARQSAKWDFGAHWASRYLIRAALEFATAPTAGNVVEIYFGSSQSGTAANANPAATTGSEAAYTGYSSNIAASVRQLTGPFLFVCTAQATTTVQVADVGIYYPASRYGVCVVVNNSAVTMLTTSVAMHIVLNPIVDEFQD